jgi:hypothetical protein
MNINWSKIDKFYLSFVIVLILLSILLIVTFKSIFSAYINAYEVNPEDIATKTRVDNKALDEAYDWIINK